MVPGSSPRVHRPLQPATSLHIPGRLTGQKVKNRLGRPQSWVFPGFPSQSYQTKRRVVIHPSIHAKFFFLSPPSLPSLSPSFPLSCNTHPPGPDLWTPCTPALPSPQPKVQASGLQPGPPLRFASKREVRTEPWCFLSPMSHTGTYRSPY